jgi:L-ascorbate metabolism protein UlaG (beta-lactamase superfamily)
MRSSILALGLLAGLSVHAQTATFIGNCAFRFQLGEATLYTDFPYESGYSGYDTYDPKLAKGLTGTTLITHEHRDHFDHALIQGSELQVISPAQDQAARDQMISALGEKAGIYIHPLTTPHADIPHFSYIVQWSRRRMFFSGDTEDPKELLAAQNIDIAFVTPWLIDAINATGKKIDARTVIMYHHQKGAYEGKEVQAPCDCKLIIPQQGEEIRLFR